MSPNSLRQFNQLLDDGNTQTGAIRAIADRAAAAARFENVVAGAQDGQLFTVCAAN